MVDARRLDRCHNAQVVISPELEHVLELIGVFVFALSGGLIAVRKDFDVVGVLVLAWSAGLGGGVLRDVLIGDIPPVGISEPRLFVTAFLAGLATMVFHPGLARIRRSVLVLDAMGLGLFAVQGTMKALEMTGNALTACVVGVLTAVGGGALRDLLSGEVPSVLHQRELYAIPAVFGAVLTALLWWLKVLGPTSSALVVVAVITLRLVAVRLRLEAPSAWRGRSTGKMEQ